MGVQLPIQNYFKPKATPTDWVRPVDWITITDTPNEVQMLVADVNLANFTIRTNFVKNSGTNMYIDWGDGSPIDTISVIGLTLTSHQYVIGTGTPCSRGYTTFVIRIYADPTSVISFCQPIAPTITSSSLAYTMGLLEVYYGNGTVNTSAPNYGGVGSASSIVGGFGLLEYVKLPQSVAWTSGMGFMFSQNQSIQKVILPTTYTGGVMDFRHFFSGCVNLRGEYVIPSSPVLAGAQLEATFSNCYNITKVTLPSTFNGTLLSSTFVNCLSLKNITLPNLPLVTSIASVFDGCTSLEWVKFNELPTPAVPGTVLFGTAFRNCVSLENVYLPATCNSNARYDLGSTFLNCVNLKRILFPLGFESVSLSSTFNNCASIVSIIFQNGFTACTTIANAFNGCRNLYDLVLPTTLGGGLSSAGGTFVSCTSLQNIVIPNTYNFTGSLNSMFAGCTNTVSITMPNTAQNSITTMSSFASECRNLKTIVLPSSMTGVTTLDFAFNECNTLESVLLPTTMNSVTTMNGCFTNCFNLSALTMPTSMSSCNIFSSTFSRNKKLTTITMPATVANGTVWTLAFFQCSALKTLTLPTSQTTTLTDLSRFIDNCGSLTTINNVNNLGSLGATPLVNISQNTLVNMLPSLSFRCPMSIFALNGSLGGGVCQLNSLRLLNTSAGQWTGASPQINVSFTSLSTAALVTLFNDMAAQGAVVGKTINITSATGAAGLTPANRAIITSIGWTIVG
jgi:hypothetical protein